VYSQIDLATAADISVDVIRKLEQCLRQTASIGTLQRIARVLDVDIGDLLGRSRPMPSGDDDQAWVLAIRDAFTSVDDLLGEVDAPDTPNLVELGRSVSYTWGAYWAGRYGVLAAVATSAAGGGSRRDTRGRRCSRPAARRREALDHDLRADPAGTRH